MSLHDIENLVMMFVFLASGVTWVALVLLAFAADRPKPSRKAWMMVAAPSVIMLGLFYSLAIHMYLTLGAWPKTIGNQGLPKDLLQHWDICSEVFGGLFFFTLFILPVIFLITVCSKRCRGLLPYLSVHAISFGICFVLTFLAPSRFLNWWWD